MAKSSALRKQLTEEGREAGRSLMKREKYRAKNGSLRNTSTYSKRATFVVLINHASAPIRKRGLSPTSKARREAAEISLWKRAGCQTESKAFEKSKFSGRERRAKRQVRLHRARGTAELREVASGSATQGIWLRNGKVRSQVSGIDRSRFSGEEQLGKLGEDEDEEGEPAIDRRRVYTDFGFDLGEREEQDVCHASALALAMTDEVRREAEM